MAVLKKACKESLNPLHLLKTIKYKIKFHQEHPDYFDPDGLLCFIGGQGSGKTISAVNYIYKLIELYPKCIIVTNIMLYEHPIVTFDDYKDNNKDKIFDLTRWNDDESVIEDILYSWYRRDNKVFLFENNDDFKKYDNDERGVIFFVDEIQLYLNSLESRNINMEVITQISQQRKQRKHIVCTSQVFGRMAKPLREQFSSVIACQGISGFMQNNALVDRDSIDSESTSETSLKGKVKKRFVWFHAPHMYKRFDSYYVIERNKFVSGENQKGGIYDDNWYRGLSNNN